MPPVPRQDLGQPGPIALALTHGSRALKAVPKFAYATKLFSDNVCVYTINATTGALTGASSDPSGRFLHAALQGANAPLLSANLLSMYN